MKENIKLAVFGVGHLGRIHLKCLQETSFDIIGFYDPDEKLAHKVSSETNISFFSDHHILMNQADAIDIVCTTSAHFQIAKQALESGKHVFIEKPVTSTVEEAEELMLLGEQKNVVIQVGHVERYNPVITSLKHKNYDPKFIEGHRLATFNNRGNDVSVILDLMIHDLDLVLHLVSSEVKDIQANGVAVVNATPDICNARITFENGCVANLTASRISMKNMRKLRLFQNNEYISLDFLKKEAQLIKLESITSEDSVEGMTINTSEGKKIISIESPEIIESNAIVGELTDFYKSITEGKEVSVSIEDGVRALSLAHQIADKIRMSQ